MCILEPTVPRRVGTEEHLFVGIARRSEAMLGRFREVLRSPAGPREVGCTQYPVLNSEGGAIREQVLSAQ